jgi:hypothetical protein
LPLYDSSDQIQPQTDATISTMVPCVGLPETFERALDMLRSYADAPVGNPNADRTGI